MSETFEGVHYVVIGRRSADKRADVETLLQGRPEFRVVVDRRVSERRQRSDAPPGERRQSDRRQHQDVDVNLRERGFVILHSGDGAS